MLKAAHRLQVGLAGGADPLAARDCESRATAQPTARILVVDDHSIVRSGLAVLLDREDGMKVVGSAATGEEAVQAARRLEPDLIIMDLALPTLNGIDATKLILGEFPQIRIIALSASRRPGHVCRALGAGAHGYVLKHAPGEEIVRAVKAVIAGGRHVSPEIAHLLPGDAYISVAQHSPFEGLSRREHDVLRRIVSGSTSAEIAKCLSLSPKTIETYRARLMVKLGVDTRAALIHLALEYELPVV
jgi:DNA-binding NarL/FixJ family response regulator